VSGGPGDGRPAERDSAERSPGAPKARRLCDVAALTADEPESAAVRWKLDRPGRQLDANVVRLPPGGEVDTHAEPELDVLFLVVDGSGSLATPEGVEEVADGALCWLPRGSVRRLCAGPDGLSYLTVHKRRPGMRIGRVPSAGG
jgi:quercetin dioxygenase-like cupin family protein